MQSGYAECGNSQLFRRHFALIVWVTNCQKCFSGPALTCSPARRNRDPLSSCFFVAGDDVNAISLQPRASKSLIVTLLVGTALGFGDRDLLKLAIAGDPVRQIAAGLPLHFNATLAVQ